MFCFHNRGFISGILGRMDFICKTFLRLEENRKQVNRKQEKAVKSYELKSWLQWQLQHEQDFYPRISTN
jgi:hypothetical protein